MFARRRFVTYKIAREYYGIGEKPMIRMAWASGAVYKIGKRVLIRRDIFEEYLREHQRQVEKLVDEDEEKLIKVIEAKTKEEHENE